MFQRFADFVCARPGWFILGWLALSGVLLAARSSEEQRTAREPKSVLPERAPSNQALALKEQAFGELASRSRLIIVLERSAGLTDGDRGYVGDLTRRLTAEAKAHEGWRVLSPNSHPFLKSRLASEDGQAVMLAVHLDATFFSHQSVQAVKRIEPLVREKLPEGLRCELTGTAAIGRDYSLQTAVALERTTAVTVSAVLIILVFVYRAPLAALVPLVSIGISLFAAFGILDLLSMLGWGVSDTERTFAVVLIFGAGTDFALFWISRYREALSGGAAIPEAAASALSAVGPAIVASAGTTIAGLTMLVLADLIPYANAGRALAVALTIALTAALTLVPAIARVLGPAMFWPRRVEAIRPLGTTGLWARVAEIVVNRPRGVLLVVLVVLMLPSLAALDMQFRYDTLGQVQEDSSSARGLALVDKHFRHGQTSSFDVLIEWPGFAAEDSGGARTLDHAREVTEILAACPGVADVWSWSSPLGQEGSVSVRPLGSLATRQARPYYLADEKPVLRFEVMLEAPPWSGQAMQAAKAIRAKAETWMGQRLGADARLSLAGSTPYILDVADFSDGDQLRVMPLVVMVIWIIVMILLRDAWVSSFMLTATLVTYATTIGLAHLFFTYVVDSRGIDYKVNLFLFVLIVAIGQDYNIFLVTRLRQEAGGGDLIEGTRRAIVRTGSVISNCGLIMAVTLGSLAVTGLDLLEQLGFALSAGVLIDTFVVRPLLVPSFFLIRAGRGRKTGEK